MAQAGKGGPGDILLSNVQLTIVIFSRRWIVDFVLLACAAFLAGLVDAVVGGGGLIQVPVLFSVFPKEIPATLLGTSKLAGVFGTSAAAVNYSRRVRVAWSAAAPAALAAFALSFAGNIAALLWFGYSGHLLWQLGLLMALCQVGGSLVGTKLAIRHGSVFVRKLFLLVVSSLILKTGYDAVLKWHS
jgi:uncharacterized membrane protein YfcA